MRKWIPVDPYNVTALELWLTEMEKDGLYLMKMGRYVASFDQKEPPKKLRPYELSEEEIKRLKKDQMKEVIGGFLCPVAVLITVIFFEVTRNQGVLLLLNDALLGAYCLIVLLALFQMIFCLRRYVFLRRYQAGKPTSKKPERRRRKVINLAVVMVLLLEGILCLLRMVNSWEGRPEETSVKVVTPELLEGTEMAEGSDIAKRSSSFAVPVQYEFTFGREKVASQTYTMKIAYYETRFSSLAESLLTALMTSQLDWNGYLRPESLEIEGVEEAYNVQYQGICYLFIRSGHKVLSVFYIGDQDIIENIADFAGMIVKK